MQLAGTCLSVETSAAIAGTAAKQTLQVKAATASKVSRIAQDKAAFQTGTLRDGHVLSLPSRNLFADFAAQLKAAIKTLSDADRLSNFDLQRLMSSYNQAETLASNVQKKADDAANAVISKI